MPANNGLRFDDEQVVDPCRPKAAEQDPEYPILGLQRGARAFPLEHGQLLTEGQDLQAQAVPGTEEGVEKRQEADEKANH